MPIIGTTREIVKCEIASEKDLLSIRLTGVRLLVVWNQGVTIQADWTARMMLPPILSDFERGRIRGRIHRNLMPYDESLMAAPDRGSEDGTSFPREIRSLISNRRDNGENPASSAFGSDRRKGLYSAHLRRVFVGHDRDAICSSVTTRRSTGWRRSP